MSRETIDVTAILKLKHGGLRAAVRKCGSQRALAEHLGISAMVLNKWCNLKGCPPRTPGQWWSAERLRDLETKLVALTGKSLNELFPESLREAEAFLRAEKTIEVDKKMPVAALLEHHDLTVARLTGPSPESSAERSEMCDAIRQALLTLPERERQIVKMRFGIDGERQAGLDETARRFGVTRERIRQLEARALRSLQNPSRASMIVDYAPPAPAEHREYVEPKEVWPSEIYANG